ncbi:MAG: protein kinase [Candidatus Eisenbacteria bacterium]|nr:protein kinase [Candidatus Eisenbacteria bacterium]
MQDSAPDASSRIGRRLGRFLIREKIGQGGYATVWRADDPLLGRTVALKILAAPVGEQPTVRRRFLHDARIAARFNHPGIVAVYEAGEADGEAFMALAYVDGETLSRRAAASLMPIAEAVRVVTAAADALAYAHAQGVIHRDVTGRNIMIARDGRVVVLDFGLAIARDMSRLTSAEAVLGTVDYLAPEAIVGPDQDARVDVYGLGIVLFEALTGTYPFESGRPEATTYARLNRPPRRVADLRPDVPAPLERIVQRAIARDRDRRHPTMEALIADLGGAPTRRRTPARRAPSRVAPAARTAHRSDPMYLGILPFATAGDEESRGARAVAERLPDAVAAALGYLPSVRIVPVPEPAALPRDVGELGRALGVNALLTGALSLAGARARVTYALRDIDGGIQFAGGMVEGSALQPFELQDAVAASVRKSLGHGAAPEAATPRDDDAASEDRYRLALRFLRRYDSDASVDGAIARLEQLARGRPDSARLHAALARAYLCKHELTAERNWQIQAVGACDRAQAIDPDAPEVALACGELWLQSGAVDRAREAFGRTLAADPGSVDAMLGVARTAQLGGRVKDAEAMFMRAIRTDTGDWRGYNRLGVLLYQQGRYETAVRRWREASRFAPDNSLLDYNLGSALYHMDRFDAAIASYRRSLALHPRASVYSSLGAALFYLGRYEEAADALERAVALAPQSAVNWGNLGSAYFFAPGLAAKAREPLDRAVTLMRDHLERHPLEAGLWAKMAGWLDNLGRHDEALEAIRRALALDSAQVDVMVHAGRVFLKAGDRRRGLDWLGRAIEHGYGVGELERDPDLAGLRDDPEFVQMIKEGRRSRHGRGRSATTRRRVAMTKKATAKKKKKKRTGTSVNHTVRLSDSSGVTPKVVSVKGGDTLCWRNTTGTAREISFTRKWVFGGRKRKVRAGKHATSTKVKVKRGLPKGRASYTVKPGLQGGPGGPSVDVQGVDEGGGG